MIVKSPSYYLDFFTMPVLAFAMCVCSVPGVLAGACALLGVVSWSLVEYWIHRKLFHRMFRREHWLHHLKPRSADGAVPAWASHAAVLLSAFVAWELLGGLGLAFLAGLTIAYWLYATTHHGIHHGWFDAFNPILGGVVRRHKLHHVGKEVNFNFLLPIGDLIFGTYEPVPFSTYVAGVWEGIERED